jgi:glycerol-3-phosphate acyltransferase PlsX
VPIVAVDAMSGGPAPDEVVKGVALVSLATDVECLVVGDEQRIQAVLEHVPYNPEHIQVLHCPGAIGPLEDPHTAVARRDTSLTVAAGAVADGRADALVSAASLEACLLAGAKHFRLLAGIRRPALTSVHARQPDHPTQDRLALLLDVGATVRCEPAELVDFALMGAAYARRISKVPSPRVGLLNTGREPTRGGDALVEAHRRLERVAGVEFVGNVEGHELLGGRADVVVCEGMLGAVVRSLVAGVADVVGEATRGAGERKLAWRLGLGLLSQTSERLRDLADSARYGGAPILGFDRLLIACDGHVSATAVANAVKVAAKAVRDRIPAEIADAIATVR